MSQRARPDQPTSPMAITSGIFSSDVNFDERLIGSLEELAALSEHLKGIGLRVVLTSGRRTGTPGATNLVMVREIP